MRFSALAAIFVCVALVFVTQSVAKHSEEVEDESAQVLSRVRRVIGGKGITKGQFPWLVSLRAKIVTKKLFGFIPVSHKLIYCGGSVLNDHWILTAAHCFKDTKTPGVSDPTNWHVRLAAVSLKSGILDKIRNFFGKIFRKSDWLDWELHIQKIITHPGYNPKNRWENDIALVRLKERVPSGKEFSNIQLISLPEDNDSSFPAPGDKCVAKGWGCTRDGGRISETARSAELEIKSARECSRYGTNMDTRLCVGKRGKGICQGDSGGPLVCRMNGKWVQTGIASFVHARRPDLYPGVFTRVSSYVKWIRSNIGNR